MLKERYKEIKDGGMQIHHHIKESMKALQVSQHSADWLAYVDFANNVVAEGLASNAVKSLDFFACPAAWRRRALHPCLRYSSICGVEKSNLTPQFSTTTRKTWSRVVKRRCACARCSTRGSRRF